MKKTFLIIGIVLLIAALLCFGISIWFHHLGGSVMDGSAALYARLFRRQQLFLHLGIGMSVPGAALLAISLIMKAN